MSDEQKLTGQCLCGAVGIEIEQSEKHIDVCHCTMCRRWGGGPFFAMPGGNGFKLSGEEHISRYTSSEWAERGFCSHCGTHLFFHYKPEDSYSFLAGLFQEQSSFALTEEIFIDEKPAYYDLSGERSRLTGAELIAKMQG